MLLTGNLIGCSIHSSTNTPQTASDTPSAQPAQPQPANARVDTADVAGLVEKLKPTVVNIMTSKVVNLADDPIARFHQFFEGGQEGSVNRPLSLGSGFIVDKEGYVVTNVHVIQGADEIRVRLSDERVYPARVVGKDPKLDLALIQILGATNLSAASLGNSDSLRVGDWVLCIGNPFGLGHTVTLGITSAKDRSIGTGPYDSFIQTDASINPGNSGGPLFNLKGEVIGIPTMVHRGGQGIGFAVPVNMLKDILGQLRDQGSVSRGKLAVTIQHVTADLAQGLGLDRARGALLTDLDPSGAGTRAGLTTGDVILSVDGSEVTRSEDLPRLVARNPPGSKIKLEVFRAGKTITLTAVLDALDGRAQPVRPPTKTPSAPSRSGIEMEDLPSGGVRVTSVSARSIAAGQLAPGDLVMEVNRTPVSSASALLQQIESAPSGSVLLLKTRRNAETSFVALKMP